MTDHKTIQIRGARTHNLKNIDVDIQRDQLVVITGLSGSGKSSLAFDTLYAEGQRRYVESLSAYARQFLSMMEKPDVDVISGLSPAISIEQKSTSHNPRSTVGTITEIYDYLRLLYARVGTPMCPEHHKPLEAQTIAQIVDHVMAHDEETPLMLLAPIVRDRKGEHYKLLQQMQAQGFIRMRLDGVVQEIEGDVEIDPKTKHTIEIVVDRIKVRPGIQQRLAESIETALRLSDGIVSVASLPPKKGEKKPKEIIEETFSSKLACSICGYSLQECEPRLFSFNSPVGACPDCEGLGVMQIFDIDKVIYDKSLTIGEGAIRGWDKSTIYYYQLIRSLADHDGFDINLPFEKLAAKHQKRILYGSGKQKIALCYVNHHGESITRNRPFEGVIPNMQRRMHESSSSAVREHLLKYLSILPCESCHGDRLNVAARNVLIDKKPLPEVTQFSIKEAFEFFDQLKFKGKKAPVAEKILKEVTARLQFLCDVGLTYLTLSRSASTLSGGEAQRIRLASQIGSGLVGVMYILDEPSIGLHQKDNQKLLNTLTHLRDLGNCVLVVEHDEDAMLQADHVIDIGPGAGVHGGNIIAQGTPKQIMANKESLTGQYLSGKKKIEVPKNRVSNVSRQQIRILDAGINNLQNINVAIPVGLLTCVTGVSGSGKSSLINGTLYPYAATELNRATTKSLPASGKVTGLDVIKRVVDIDQSPIGRTPRSNPATYTGMFSIIRDLFAATHEARTRGYKPGRFSFNVKGGRCEACEGDGVTKVEMHFLADVYVKCDVCQGKRYNRETLTVRYKGKNISEVLAMTVEEALEFFSALPPIARRLQTLVDVGLSYLTLGQSATTLSGGEAQRVKLARELSKRDTGVNLYILDEPTTGLHFHDVAQLLQVLHRLRDHGNTVVVIEHNLDVIKTADWIIDLGPEGGDGGGQVVAEGTPEKVVKVKESATGHFLKKLLDKNGDP
jgi:excinuclease ABC subunit A